MISFKFDIGEKSQCSVQQGSVVLWLRCKHSHVQVWFSRGFVDTNKKRPALWEVQCKILLRKSKKKLY